MISVIIVCCRYYNENRLRTVVKSILSSKNKNIEILISTYNAKKLRNLEERVKIIEVKSDIFKNNLGFYRNIAVKYSDGEYLYFTDADVVIYNQGYLGYLMKIAEQSDESVIVWPKMFRLDEGIEEFCKDFITGRQIEFPSALNHYMYGYNNGRFYKISEVKTKFEGVTHVCRADIYNKLKGVKFEELEDIVWKPSIHWGGIFCRKDYFESVGGFSLEYFNWGCEDDDLIWKLSKKYNVIHLFKNFHELSVLHLEHPRRYWTYYKRNMRIYEKRKHMDVNYIISADKKKYYGISKDIAHVVGGDNNEE